MNNFRISHDDARKNAKEIFTNAVELLKQVANYNSSKIEKEKLAAIKEKRDKEEIDPLRKSLFKNLFYENTQNQRSIPPQ